MQSNKSSKTRVLVRSWKRIVAVTFDHTTFTAGLKHSWQTEALSQFYLALMECLIQLERKRSIWIPHIRNTMKCNEESVLIGHSSGAVAALRFAEEFRVKGIVLVAAYDNSLGDDGEQASGYFDGPFDWAKIKKNCGFIVQFAGAEDSLVPVEVQRRVRDALMPKVVYIEEPEGDHFFEPPFTNLIDQIEENCSK
ncbi:putative hydrolase RBBP9-like protein [Obelidium mucronatum]|nr:putative hydrolase RBBP9-like protein [Obelidium mucronatum]